MTSVSMLQNYKSSYFNKSNSDALMAPEHMNNLLALPEQSLNPRYNYYILKNPIELVCEATKIRH